MITDEQIIDFMKSEESEIDFPFTPLGEIRGRFDSLGLKEDEIEVNGWESDFLWWFDHKDYGRFSLEGSLWKGNWILSRH